MIIYVAGYQKSGTTWMTRLIGDALNCPTGGSISKEDVREIATEGQHRRNQDTVVRKGHFVLRDEPSAHPVSQAHSMNWKAIREEEHRILFVVRDPRDIAISAAHHWNISVDSTLRNMVVGTNNFRATGQWKMYINSWLERARKFNFVVVKYEDMLAGPKELVRVLDLLQFDISVLQTKEAYDRQSFVNRVADIEKNGYSYKLGKQFNKRFMRKGVAGDWRNHFTREWAFDVETVFGDLLRFFEYESDPYWWKEIL